MIPVGYGLPVWLDTDVYLSAPEVRSLGSYDIGTREHCAQPGCQGWPIEAAHIARKGMGGQKDDGPQVLVCRTLHAYVDNHAIECCFAVRRSDGAVGVAWEWGHFDPLGFARDEQDAERWR